MCLQGGSLRRPGLLLQSRPRGQSWDPFPTEATLEAHGHSKGDRHQPLSCRGSPTGPP